MSATSPIRLAAKSFCWSAVTLCGLALPPASIGEESRAPAPVTAWAIGAIFTV